MNSTMAAGAIGCGAEDFKRERGSALAIFKFGMGRELLINGCLFGLAVKDAQTALGGLAPILKSY